MEQINLVIKDETLQNSLSKVCESIQEYGGRALLVGGCVRDAVSGIVAKDFDIEVYGIRPEKLVEILSQQFRIDLVGQAFGVIKIHHLPIDVSIPRRESKSGFGHKGFDINSDPEMTPVEAAYRRDFTINSMAYDLLTKEIIDPYNGLEDLKNKILRHTSEKFVEDPLRVLRGMQFASRLNLTVAPETIELCRSIKTEGLPAERIFEEWKKLLLYGKEPSRGLKFLRDCGWISYFPELEALIGCEQDPGWHPEGDVWIHTLHCLDAFASERIGDEWEDLVVGFAVLCHDFGKPLTTKFENGRIRLFGHEPAGEEPTRSFLHRMTNHIELAKAIIPLVTNHLCPKEFFDIKAGNSAIRRLAKRVGRIDRLVRVARADQMGRPPLKFDGFPAGDWLLEKAHMLDVKDTTPKPIVMGRHLIKLGLEPGPLFGTILEQCFDAQIEEKFSDLEEGIEYAKGIIAEA